MIMDAATETGFITVDDQGERIGTGKDGCKGFLKWLIPLPVRRPLTKVFRDGMESIRQYAE
jgi:hypothetical protein